MPLSFAFHPRLIDALRGYDKSRWLADVGAGVTVGIVALPLAMAFAIASGLKPEAGLWTAIIAGFLISALGGTSVQIGGPAGAFIVIVYGIVERYGVANLLISTACAGVLLVLLGLLLSLPIPFTNYLIGGLILLFALALLERDGALMLVAWGVGIVTLATTGTLSGGLITAVQAMIGKLS